MDVLIRELYNYRDDFIEDLDLNDKDDKTIDNYSRICDFFIEYLIEQKSIRKLEDINIKLIQYFLRYRESKIKITKRVDKISEWTKINDIKVLRLFLDYIEENNNIIFNIKWKKISPKVRKKEKPHLSKQEIEKVLSRLELNIKNKRKEFDYMLSFAFKLALFSGLRATEICKTQLVDFGEYYKVNNKTFIDITIYGKNNTVYTNPLPYDAIKKELNYFKRNNQNNDNILFKKKTLNQQINRFDLYRYFEEVSKESGIENTQIHKIRHTFANNLVDSGVDLMELQDLMRHSSPTTTRIYAKRNKSRMVNAIGNLF